MNPVMATMHKPWETIKNVGKVALAGYVAMQVPLTVLRNSNGDKDSFRQRYEEKFGIDLVGYEGEINSEENYNLRYSLVNSAQRRIDLGLPLPNQIHLESRDFLKKNLCQQAYSAVSSGYGGFANPLTGNITLTSGTKQSTVEHEHAHIDTFYLRENSPEFIKRWEELAKDDEGNSMYLNPAVAFCKKFKGLEYLLGDSQIHRQEENLKDGFVSNYARTNVLEDIAETVEEVVGGILPGGMEEYLDSNKLECRDSRLRKKVELMEEFGLIPKGHGEYRELRGEMENLWNSSYRGSIIDISKVGDFLDFSEEFINKNPESSYLSQVHLMRADALVGWCVTMMGKSMQTPENAKKAIEEAKKAIESLKSSNYHEFSGALILMEDAFSEIGDSKSSRSCLSGLERFYHYRRENPFEYKQNTIDFLRAEGILN